MQRHTTAANKRADDAHLSLTKRSFLLCVCERRFVGNARRMQVKDHQYIVSLVEIGSRNLQLGVIGKRCDGYIAVFEMYDPRRVDGDLVSFLIRLDGAENGLDGPREIIE